MKRLRKLVGCGAAAACAAALLACLAGCSSVQRQSYTPPEATPTISSPAIAQEGTLRVGVNTGNAPLAGQPSSSTDIVGIDVDVAAALADKLGLKLEVVDVGTDADSALADGTVDLVMGIDKSDASGSFWTSEAYLPTAVALFSTAADAAVPTAEEAPAIAAQVSSKSAWAVANEFDSGNITTTEDLKGAFDALQAGEVQYVAADALIGTYAAHSSKADLHIAALMQQPSGYAVGVLDGNTELKQAVSEALSALSADGVIAIIQAKWLGEAVDLSQVPLTAGASAGTGDSDDVMDILGDAGIGDDADADEDASADGDAAADGDGQADDGSDAEDGDGDVAANAGSNAVQPEDAQV